MGCNNQTFENGEIIEHLVFFFRECFKSLQLLSVQHTRHSSSIVARTGSAQLFCSQGLQTQTFSTSFLGGITLFSGQARFFLFQFLFVFLCLASRLENSHTHFAFFFVLVGVFLFDFFQLVLLTTRQLDWLRTLWLFLWRRSGTRFKVWILGFFASNTTFAFAHSFFTFRLRLRRRRLGRRWRLRRRRFGRRRFGLCCCK
mmetsp:Transcript_19142/g.28484  ORF Transcript_19142/g.28484 Transcript_19142/m.28484 type:complete len:200 (+) Transcript_19142:310-909(+)